MYIYTHNTTLRVMGRFGGGDQFTLTKIFTGVSTEVLTRVFTGALPGILTGLLTELSTRVLTKIFNKTVQVPCLAQKLNPREQKTFKLHSQKSKIA